MPDFNKFLAGNTGDAKPPAMMPEDDYPAIVSKKEYGDNNQNKTPYLRVFFKFLAPGQGAGSQEHLEGLGIKDVTKRQMKKDFFLRGRDESDEDARENCMYQLEQFLIACGVPKGTSREEGVNMIDGAQVLVTVAHKINERAKDPERALYAELSRVSPLR